MRDEHGLAPIIVLIITVLVVAILGGTYYLERLGGSQRYMDRVVTLSGSPPLVTPSSSSFSLPNRKCCTSDKDCGSNQHCVTPGSIAVDPSQNKSYCWNDNEALPL